MRSSTHYFHMRTKILAVFQICTSATLTSSFYYMFYIHVIWSFIFVIYFIFMLYVYYILTINLYVCQMFFIFLFLHFLILNLYDNVFIFIIIFIIVNLYSRYCITLSDWSDAINLTCFLYQICLTDKSDENDYLYVQNTEQRRIKNPVKHLRWNFLKCSYSLKTLDYFQKKSPS